MSGPGTGPGDLAEASVAKVCARRGTARRCTGGASKEELRRIGHAKTLQPQIQTIALRKADRLRQCGIQVEKAGPAEIVPAHIPECSGRWRGEARRSEPGTAGADPMKAVHRSNQIRRLGIPWRQKRGRNGCKG